jgi:hypothetical protein
MNDKKWLLEFALKGLQSERNQLSQQIAEIEAELRRVGGSRSKTLHAAASAKTGSTPVVSSRKKRKMSAAARKKLSEAAKRRWAVSKKAGKKTL